jgi:hypothetical protein
MKILTLLLLFASLSLQSAELSKQQLELLEKGEKIVINEEVEDMTWPKTTVHMLFKAPALESFAFYVAYKYQKEYVPNVVLSDPVIQKNPTHVIVSYKQTMPWPVEDAVYKTGNIIEKLGKNQFKISWYQVESNSTELAEGYALFRPHGAGTLFTYVGQTEPKSIFGGLLKDIAPKNLQKTLEKIKTETETSVKEKPELLKKFVKLVTDSFAGKFVYVSPKRKK